MLALLQPIKDRLQALPELAGFDARDNMQAVDRRPVPAFDVRMPGASVPVRKGQGVMLAPLWQITLMVKPGTSAATELDAALAATVDAMHGWAAQGEHGGRRWERFELQAVTEAVTVDEGAVGYQLSFTTSALYRGQTV